MQIEKAPEVQYLEFVGIRDSRQTDICRARSGVIRPKGDPWWKTNRPPLHFSCRSTVRAISRFEVERQGIRVTRKKRLENLPPPQEGFGLDPLNSGTFWKLTPSMIERARRYGILGEIRELAKWLGLEEVELENLKMKAYPKELVEKLGERKTLSIKTGDLVPKWEKEGSRSRSKTKVIQIYKDLLDNEVWLTQYTVQHALKIDNRNKRKEKVIDYYQKAILNTTTILKEPELVLDDNLGTFYYGKKEGAFWLFVVVDKKTRKILTYIVRKSIPSNLKRFKVIYDARKN